MKAGTPGALRRDYPEMALELDTDLIRQEVRWNMEIACRSHVGDNKAAVIIPGINCYTLVVTPTKVDEFGNPRWFTYSITKLHQTGEIRRSHVINATIKVMSSANYTPKEVLSKTVVMKDMQGVVLEAVKSCHETGFKLCFIPEPLQEDEK